MRDQSWRLVRNSVVGAGAVLLSLAGPAWGGQATSATAGSKDSPVVRTFGSEGGYRTKVTSETKGTLSQDDRRQVSLLAAQVFQHIDEARQAIGAGEDQRAHQEVDKGREALKVIRALLPKTTVHTQTTAPGGKVIYEDQRDVQDDRVPLFEGMLHAETLAPILEAKRDAVQVAGVRLVGAESIVTEALADLDLVESQLAGAARALDGKKSDEAVKALTMAQVQGVELRSRKEDAPLAEARDAIWLAKRALEENNPVQAQANLAVARQRLEIYRQLLPEKQRQDVNQMMTEVDQLEAQLRHEPTQPASRSERTRQGNSVARWWDQVNGWFKRHF